MPGVTFSQQRSDRAGRLCSSHRQLLFAGDGDPQEFCCAAACSSAGSNTPFQQQDGHADTGVARGLGLLRQATASASASGASTRETTVAAVAIASALTTAIALARAPERRTNARIVAQGGRLSLAWLGRAIEIEFMRAVQGLRRQPDIPHRAVADRQPSITVTGAISLLELVSQTSSACSSSRRVTTRSSTGILPSPAQDLQQHEAGDARQFLVIQQGVATNAVFDHETLQAAASVISPSWL